jgi:hypothetical protein
MFYRSVSQITLSEMLHDTTTCYSPTFYTIISKHISCHQSILTDTYRARCNGRTAPERRHIQSTLTGTDHILLTADAMEGGTHVKYQ